MVGRHKTDAAAIFSWRSVRFLVRNIERGPQVFTDLRKTWQKLQDFGEFPVY